MDSNKLRDLYDTFLDSGELNTVLPEAKGIWEKDKHLFEAIYNVLDETLLKVNEEDDDEDGEDPIDFDNLDVYY